MEVPMKRVKLESENLYLDDKGKPAFFSSGCAVLDCVLGGGWAKDRVSNIIGNESSGKTLLAIEACANFLLKYGSNSRIRYNEAEAAFDVGYAHSVGLPEVAEVTIGEISRDVPVNLVEDCIIVEDLERDIVAFIDTLGDDEHGFYVIDSLDALSDKAELERDIDKGSYNMGKPARMSAMFRKLVKKMKHKHCTLLVVSQVRDKIGVVFGKKYSVSGGRALNFYASQRILLSQIKKLVSTRRKVKRPVGIQVAARCEKLKVGNPFRECTFPIIFNFGVDDVQASVEYLTGLGVDMRSVFKLPTTTKPSAKVVMNQVAKMTDKAYDRFRRRLAEVVRNTWDDIEEDFRPSRRKYKGQTYE
jgi:recombination protein RecA